MNRMTTGFLSLCFLVCGTAAAGDALERLDAAARVTSELMAIPEGIPDGLLDRAECVAVLPSVKKLALGVGGSYGKGALVCRTGEDFTGAWGPPAMVRLEGGSIGLQLGGEATDYLLLFVNERGLESLLSSKVKLGADASVAAGPKGRTAAAGTDAWMQAEILSYSRARGLFAGVSLEGSTLRSDDGANEELYGREVTARTILRSGNVQPPKGAWRLTVVLQEHSPSRGAEVQD